MSRHENLKKYLEEKKKDKKFKKKMGALNSFSMAGLDATIPTLHLPFDDLCGGLQRGTVVEFYGDESSGKTTTICKILDNLVRSKSEEELGILFIDCEGTANMKFIRRFRELKDDKIIFYKEFLIENIWETIDELVEAEALDIVVLDSIGSVQTAQEDEKDLHGNTIGSLAKKINGLVKKFYQLAEDSGLTVIVVNQQYENPGAAMSYGGPSKNLKGGNALKFAKSVSVEVKKNFSQNATVTEKINGEDVVTEVLTSYTARKNKLGAPLRTSYSYLNVLVSRPTTFIYTKDVLNYASKFEFIKVAGSWFTAYSNDGKELYKCQGGTRMASYIELNPSFYITLKMQVYSKIYEPYEFYFHFKTLKDFLSKEFEAMKERAEEKIKYSELDEEELETVAELTELVFPLSDVKITDYLTDKQIDSALFELSRFYPEEELEKIKKRTEC